MNRSTVSHISWRQLALLALSAAALILLVAGKGLTDGLNHDEHQFLAPALLISHGLLPYRDFAIFHLPNLSLIDVLFLKTGWPFLCARLFNSLCAAIAVALIFRHAFAQFREHPFGRRYLLAAACIVLVLFAPLFISTTGKAWNHDLPMLLTVAAVLLFLPDARGPGTFRVIGAGLCMGLAIGTRLTFAPLVAPFLLSLPFFPLSRMERLKLALIFGAALVVALLPTWWCLISDPHAFRFDNFGFPRLRLMDPSDERARKTMQLWRKLRYFFKEIAVSNLPLFLSFFGIALPGLVIQLRRNGRGDAASIFFALLIVFALAGCLAPTRYQYQHFYIMAPLFGLLLVHCLSRLQRLPVLTWMAVGLLATAEIAVGLRSYADVLKLPHPREWPVVHYHELALELRRNVPAGKVLTFAPIFAAEAGLDIYPEFATGPFAFRLAHLMQPGERKKMHIASRDDLDGLLENDAPAALLLGFETPEFEAPLREYAERHRFHWIYKRKDIEILVPRQEK